MESRFDRLVQKDSYQAKTLYHGTTASAAESINKRGISLDNCRGCTDFNGVI